MTYSLLLKITPVLLLVGCMGRPVDTLVPVQAQAYPRPDSLTSLYRSTDLGRTWTPIGDGLPEDLQVAFLDTLGKQLVLATNNHGLYLSDPKKESWQQLDSTAFTSQKITSLHVAKGVIYVGVFEQGVMASDDMGKTWASLNHGLKGEFVSSILRTSNELWIGTGNGIYSLADGATVWQHRFENAQVTSLLKVGENFMAGSHKGILFSKNKGASWDWLRTKGMSDKLSVIDGKIIATYHNNDEMEVSEDMGKTWTSVHEGFKSKAHVLETAKIGGTLVNFQTDGIYLSEDWGKAWKNIYRFSYTNPFGVVLSYGEQWDEVYSRPAAPFVKLVILDGVVYGGTVRGC